MKAVKTTSLFLFLLILVSALSMTALADDAPAIVTDVPVSVTVTVGESLSLTADISGGGLSYQWYKNDYPVEGQTTSSYYEANVTMDSNGARYYLYAQNPYGGVKTGTCTLTVREPMQPPTVTADIPATVTASEGGTITLTASASGENVSAQWYIRSDSSSRPIDGQTGNTLSLTARSELNGADLYCQFSNQAGAVITSFCRVTVSSGSQPSASPGTTAAPGESPSPTPASGLPVTTKDPYGEVVDEGGGTSFIARADNAERYLWRFVSPDGRSTYDYNKVGSQFPGMIISGGTSEQLYLSYIPYELNGWKVYCVFSNSAGDTASGEAAIQVRKASSVLSVINQPIGGSMAMDENPDFILSIQAKASNGGDLSYQWYKAATNSASAMQTIPGATNSSYKPERSEGTAYYRVSVTLRSNGITSEPFYSTIVPVTFTAAKTHEHVYSSIWEYNDISHWHQCTCGDHADEEFHQFSWTVLRPATADREGEQRGECAICGYETVQTIPAGMTDGEAESTPTPEPAKTPARRSFGSFWMVFLGILALAVIAGAVFLIHRVMLEDDEDEEEYEDDEK